MTAPCSKGPLTCAGPSRASGDGHDAHTTGAHRAITFARLTRTQD